MSAKEMLNELHQEGATTRRLLERVPAEKLDWRPHPKAMTLGQLALHMATIPGAISGLAALSEFDAANANFDPPAASSVEALLVAHDVSINAASQYLNGLTDESGAESWRLTSRGAEVFTTTRTGILRSILFNHWYHHRGQLSVYLRFLDVPLPVIYGRSADENLA